MDYDEIVARRRAPSNPRFKTLADVGFDWDVVTPLQQPTREAWPARLLLFRAQEGDPPHQPADALGVLLDWTGKERCSNDCSQRSLRGLCHVPCAV